MVIIYCFRARTIVSLLNCIEGPEMDFKSAYDVKVNAELYLLNKGKLWMESDF